MVEFTLIPQLPEPGPGRRGGACHEGIDQVLFPIVVFIFPALFVVILGSAFLNLSRLF